MNVPWQRTSRVAGILAVEALLAAASGCSSVPVGAEKAITLRGGMAGGGDAGMPCLDETTGTAIQSGSCICPNRTGIQECCDDGTLVDGSGTCADSGTDSGSGQSTPSSEPGIQFGMSGLDDGPSFESFLKEQGGATAGQVPPKGLCHVYTYWDIADRETPPGDPDATGSSNRTDLFDWMTGAPGTKYATDNAIVHCSEVLVTFKGAAAKDAKGNPIKEDPPDATCSAGKTCFKSAFEKFVGLTKPAGRLAGLPYKISFTAWNEPNNPAGGGNGLDEDLTPERAAEYFMVAADVCKASNAAYDLPAGSAKAETYSCSVAAGDFATNGSFGEYVANGTIEENCVDVDAEDDVTSHDGHWRCKTDGSHNPMGWDASYLDRYKHYIATHGQDYSNLKSGFRPAHWAYHPWHDVNAYIDSNASCYDYEHCVTRRLLDALGSSWGSAEIWDTEISVGQQNDILEKGEHWPAHTRDDQAGQIQLSSNDDGVVSETYGSTSKMFQTQTKPCGAAFLVQLTKLSSRFSRVYYLWFGEANGAVMGTPAAAVLERNKMSYDDAGCSASGLLSTYSNPIIPMFSLDEPSERDEVDDLTANPTEGCPDPQGMRTHEGHYYVYCTSYSLQHSRYGGFPVFEAGGDGLATNDWERVSWLIPPTGERGRDAWPSWIVRNDGDFWGPDVHEVHRNGRYVYVALYAAPHRYGDFTDHKPKKNASGDVVGLEEDEDPIHQSIGMQWSDSPTGPWTRPNHMFISACSSKECSAGTGASENGDSCADITEKDSGGKEKTIGHTCSDDTYDPNLLVLADDMYVFWSVAGRGIFGQNAELKSPDGELELTGKPVKIAEHGEGPYVIERTESGKPVFYLFYSTSDDPSQSLLYSYQVRVQRLEGSSTPLVEPSKWKGAPRPVVQKSAGANGQAVNPDGDATAPLQFLAPGGNSVIQGTDGGPDYLVYHAVVAPQGPKGDLWCGDIEDRNEENKETSTNPYCRGQGQRQAMIDPLDWSTGFPLVDGETLPALPGATRSPGVPSTGPIFLPGHSPPSGY